jgi:hypothetical protein
MSLHVLTLEEKLAVVQSAINAVRKKARLDPVAKKNFEALKAVAADLEARIAFPTSNTLGSLRRGLELVKQSKTALGYDQGRLLHVANIVISKWPTISQALEQFGEESAE